MLLKKRFKNLVILKIYQVTRYQSLCKEEKEKKQQHGYGQYKIYQKMKDKSLLSIEKDIIK